MSTGSKDAVLKWAKTSKETIICKSITVWQVPVDLRISVCLPARHPFCLSFDFCGSYSKPS